MRSCCGKHHARWKVYLRLVVIMKILLTGGCGFIGSNLAHLLIEDKGECVLNLDKLTYAGNLRSVEGLSNHPNYRFECVDLGDFDALREIFRSYQPDAVMHLAAESHVDRSIDGPKDFIQTNIVGTFHLLQAALEYWRSLPECGIEKKDLQGANLDDLHAGLTKETFRFVHVSTDEVFGSLQLNDAAFTEESSYSPRSPYSASKAASDHLARAWRHTYGLPVIVTNCSNNYGPLQFPEKLIPVVILKCLRGEPIPIYGSGENIRDWLFVRDHAEALYTTLRRGCVGETYNIGGNNEWRNIDLVRMLCSLMDQYSPGTCPGGAPHESLIHFVKDRPGHDLRYAMNSKKICDELDWQPQETGVGGFHKTVEWYLKNSDWWEPILNGQHRLERMGVSN